jgi:uncharacterized protein YdhG (YjbR/CyaY superfamily)
MNLALDRGLIMCGQSPHDGYGLGRTQLRNDDETGFPKLAAPARRALSAAGYTRLDQLAQVPESDLTKLHGMGATAIAALRDALHERDLSFHAGVPASGRLHGAAGSPGDVDEYLRGVEEPGRSTLQTLRRTILEIVPDAEQVISYRVPAFRTRGETVAGFAAFKNHLSYLPFSGSVLSQLANELEAYAMTKSSLHFPVDRPLPKALVKKLIAVRLTQVGRRTR